MNSGNDVTANYAISYDTKVKGLTVGQVPLTIKAKDQAKCFGQGFNFAGTEFTTLGLLNSDVVNSVTLTSDGAAAPAAPGSYSIVPSDAAGSGLGNYSISYVNGNFTVNAHPTASISGTTAICIGNTPDLTVKLLTGSGTINGTLSDGTPFSGTAPSILTINPATAPSTGITTYTLATLTDANGCSADPGERTGSAVITVNANSTISGPSVAGNDNQTVCINEPISNISYTVGGGATGVKVVGLPKGVSSVFDASTGLVTISGTPTDASSVYPYTVTTLGPCTNESMMGTITVSANSTLDLTSSIQDTTQAICIGTSLTPITYLIDGGSTGHTVI
ncbi:MAG: MBG domain-containing protein, partial [Nitrososphaerales archaeon]